MNSRQEFLKKVSEGKPLIIKPVGGTSEEVALDLLAYLSEIRKVDFLSGVIDGPKWGMLTRAAGLLSSLDVYFMDKDASLDSEDVNVMNYRPLSAEVDALYQVVHRNMASDSEEVRVDAVNQAGKMADPVFVEPLSELLRNDESAAVRNRALFSLEDINTPEVLPYIKSALNDEDENVRSNAERALEFLLISDED